jgi:hypothetical protein
MSPIVLAVGALVILVVTFKVLRAVTSGCFKLLAMALLLGGLVAAYYFLKDRIVVP